MSSPRPLLLRLALLLLIGAAGPAARAERSGEVRKNSFELLNEGVSAYNRADYAVAVEKLRQTAGISLNSFRAHYFLGLALIGHRDYRAAIESLNIALDLDPTHLQSLVATGDAYLKLGDIDEAHAAYFRAINLRPAYAPALDGLARAYELQAKDDSALEHYRRAIASDRGFAPAYTHLGDLYLRQGRFQEAVRLLEEAVAIRPDYAPGLNRLGLAYGRLGMAGEAVATVQRAIELEPKAAEHRATLGRLELDQGLLAGAERSFERALELEPGMPEARLGLAEVARRRGEYARALEEIDGGLAVERLEPLLERRLREFRVVIEQEERRVTELLARIAANEATAEDQSALARVHAERGDFGRAAELEAPVADTPERRERLAFWLFRAGRFREAHDLYVELARDGDVSLALNAGVTLAKLGNDSEALDTFDRILASEPGHRLARLYRGNALLRLGRQADAAQSYRAFLEQDDRGEAAERVRRILKQIAPALLPPGSDSAQDGP